MRKQRILTGSDDFRKFIETKDSGYIDKSLMIKDFLDSGDEVTLITRPRRWGKTLNMSMLQHFLAPTILGKPTDRLFNNLAIAKVDGGEYMQEHQGQYPVVMLTFKDIVADQGYEDTINQIAGEISDVCRNLSKDKIVKDFLATSDEQIVGEFKKLMEKKASHVEVRKALKTITEFLSDCYGKKVILLLDEYDMPLNRAYGKECFEALSNFMKSFLGAGFKGNSFLKQGLVTGVLRISQASMWSGLNNPCVYTVFEKQYSEYYGFTPQEVERLLQKAQISNARELKDWYNGYQIGGLTIYNPWSIVNSVKNGGSLEPYWLYSGDDTLIRKALSKNNSDIKEKLRMLLEKDGSTIKVRASVKCRFDQLTHNTEAFFGLLLSTGYLTAETVDKKTGVDYLCTVRIPNQEIKTCYKDIIRDWFESKNISYGDLLDSLVTGKIETFAYELQKFFMGVVSVHDLGAIKKRESSYHMLMLGLVAGLIDDYYISSNKESGLGRYDIGICPRKPTDSNLGVILEFKHEAKEKNIEENMEKGAEEALLQIEKRQYTASLVEYGVKNILAIGIAFHKKQFKYKTKLLLGRNLSERIEKRPLFPGFHKDIDGQIEGIFKAKQNTEEKRNPSDCSLGGGVDFELHKNLYNFFWKNEGEISEGKEKIDALEKLLSSYET